MFRYSVLGRQVSAELDTKAKGAAILRQHDSSCKDWQVGKTKVGFIVCNCTVQLFLLSFLSAAFREILNSITMGWESAVILILIITIV